MAIRVQRTTIAHGDGGVSQTLQQMAHLIDTASDDPAVVSFARRILVRSGTNTRNPVASAVTIRNWLSSVWRFVEDPVNRELLRDANAMVREYAQTGVVMGDCDEAAILGASLGTVVGLPAALTVLAFEEDGSGVPPYSHVFATLLPDGGPEINLDITRPRNGTPTPAIARTLTVAV